MALQDFIKTLEAQEDTDTVYSKKPDPTIKVIPPQSSNNTQKSIVLNDSTRVIPPHNEPVVIKFTNLNIRKSEPEKVSVKKKPVSIKFNKPSTNEQPTREDNQIRNQPRIDEPKKPTRQESEEDIIEKLFLLSETPLEKKSLWVENYKGANMSKKNTELVNKIKSGRFTFDKDNNVILLSDYITSDKSVSAILNDKWLKTED